MQDRVVIFGSMVCFSGSANLTVLLRFAPTDPCCHETKFETKYACMRDISQIIAADRGFSGSCY